MTKILNKMIVATRSRGYATLSSAEYCMNLVKNHDYENFMSTLLLEKECRSLAFAIRSFNVEIARVAEHTSREDTALMRFQFWEDTVNSFYSSGAKTPQHPVAIELCKAVNHRKLSRRNLKNLISSRREHFQSNKFDDFDDMEKYLDRSVSSVYYSILEGSNIKNVHADHAASHLGKAQGIVQLLRSVPLIRQLNFIPLPQSVLVKNSVSQESLIRSKSSQPLSDCIYEVASRAHQHLLKSRNLQDNVPPEAKRIFMPAVSVASYLDRLERVNYDVFSPKLKYRQWNLLFKMLLGSFRNKY